MYRFWDHIIISVCLYVNNHFCLTFSKRDNSISICICIKYVLILCVGILKFFVWPCIPQKSKTKHFVSYSYNFKKKDKKSYQSDFNSCRFNNWFKLRPFVCNWGQMSVCENAKFLIPYRCFKLLQKSLTCPSVYYGVKYG